MTDLLRSRTVLANGPDSVFDSLPTTEREAQDVLLGLPKAEQLKRELDRIVALVKASIDAGCYVGISTDVKRFERQYVVMLRGVSTKS